MFDSQDANDSDQIEKDLENNNKNKFDSSYPFTKLSKFLYSILASKLGVDKNENIQEEEANKNLAFKSKTFEKLFPDYNNQTGDSNSFKQKKFSKLISLFKTCENYYSIMILNGNSSEEADKIQNIETKTDENISNCPKIIKKEFYKCGLCFHYLNDPITLVCGCTFCKMCIEEYNHSQFQIAVLKQYSDPSKHLYKCRNCEFSHNQNSSQYLSTNIFISKIVDKSFATQIESRKLRNDIRKCIYLKKIDYNKAINLLSHVFSLDETNHLILVDLFFLHFFNQSFENCQSLVDKLINIVPNWPLTYFIRSLCNQYKEDFDSMSLDLITCLQLDSNLDYVRAKLYKLSVYLKSHNLDSTLLEEFLHKNKKNDDTSSQEKPTENAEMLSSVLNDEKIKENIDGLSKVVKISDMECSLCYRLLYNPVSTPCGHVFCCACLDRSLDHQDKCPLCKRSLSDYLAERRQCTTIFLDEMIKACLPNEYTERKSQYEEELADLIKNEHEIPIFVCTLALPGVNCPLHIYEPRYRLMLRRALATTKQFGMCVHIDNNEYANYGCMLEIKKAQFLRDGRAVIDTIGGRRFKVVRRNLKDGYCVADVEWLRDIKINNQEVLQKLNKEVYELSRQWYEQLSKEQKDKISESFGISQIPAMDEKTDYCDNGPDWHWFLLHILPLDTEFQMKFLSTTNLMARLNQLKMILRIILKSCEKQDSKNKNEAGN